MVVDAADDLYRLDLADFTAARDALAKQLRAAGDRAGADRVKKLRRPTLTAWGLNRAAHQQPGLVDAAFAAGAGLRAATRRAIGGDASALRPAQRAERHAVEQVVSAAADALRAAGHQANDAARTKMAETIRAAMVDEQVAAGLRHGVLDRDHQVTGFGLEGGEDDVAQPEPAQPDTAVPPAEMDDQVARQRAKKRAAELSTRARGQAEGAGRLRAAAAQAQRRAAEASQAAAQAQSKAAEARQAADEAQRLADGAEQHAAEADRQAAEAEQQAAEAEHEAAAASAETEP